MNIRVIRASGRSSAGTNTDPVYPRLHVAALPNPAPSPLSIALSCTVPSVRVFRPIQGETLPHKPLTKIGITDRARSHRASIAIEADRIAVHRSARDEGVQFVRGLRTASVRLAIFAPAELGGLGRIDAPEANTVAVDFQCVAVDDARLPDQIVRKSHAAESQQHDPGDHPHPLSHKFIPLAR